MCPGVAPGAQSPERQGTGRAPFPQPVSWATSEPQ